MTLRNTVKLKKYLDVNMEFDAGGTITPGHLIKLGSGNTVTSTVAEGVGALPKMFALEDELQGKTIDDNYVSGDPVQCWICQPGEVVYALLYDGETVVIGDPLTSKGDGTLKKATPATTDYDNTIVGIALEALDLSGSSGEEPTMRIPVLIV
jgi:hypothetical protein